MLSAMSDDSFEIEICTTYIANVVGMAGMNICKDTNENKWLDRESKETPSSLTRWSTTKLSRPLLTVHLAKTITFLPFYISFVPEDTYDKQKFTLSCQIY